MIIKASDAVYARITQLQFDLNQQLLLSFLSMDRFVSWKALQLLRPKQFEYVLTRDSFYVLCVVLIAVY